MARYNRPAPRRHDKAVNTNAVDGTHAPRLRRELQRLLEDTPLEFRERIVRTAVLSRREATRLLKDAPGAANPERMNEARALIHEYAARPSLYA